MLASPDGAGPARRLGPVRVPGLTREARRALLLAAATLFVENIFYVAVLPLLPAYADDLDLSTSGVGLLVGAYAAGVILGSAPAALLGVRIGFRRLAAVGLLVLAAGTVGFAAAESVVLLDGFRCLQGVGAGLAFVGALGWTAAVAPPESRGLVIGVVMATAVVGSIVGPAFGALATSVGVGWVFGTLAALQGLLGLAVLAQREAATGPAPARGGGGRPRRRIQLIALSMVAVPALLVGVYEVLTPLELDAAGAGTTQIAAVFLIAAMVEVVAGPIAGRVSDRTGRLPLLGGSLLVAPTGCLALTIASDRTVLLVLAVVALVVATVAYTPALALIADLSGGAGTRAAQDWSLLNVAIAGGVLVGAIAGPLVAEPLGDAAPYLIGWALCFAVAGVAWVHRVELGAGPRRT